MDWTAAMKLLELVITLIIVEGLESKPYREPLLLSTLINHNQIKEAREAAFVNNNLLLPGMESYAGYLTVNLLYESYLWFWYFPVRESRNVYNNPWILWLQGGPGVSSLYGLFTEIGPLAMTPDNKVKEMTYSWGKNHSLLFIDSPVGTGYSYTKNHLGYAQNQTIIAAQLHDALEQFMRMFPELRSCPLTIVGEAYAAKHVLALGKTILYNKQEDEDYKEIVTLHGFAIGNPWLGPHTLPHWHSFLRELGFVDPYVADHLQYQAQSVMNMISLERMIDAFEMYNEMVNDLFVSAKLKHKYAAYNYGKDHFRSSKFKDFIQTPEMRKALNVGSVAFKDFERVFDTLRPDYMISAKKWLEDLAEHYPILIYHGNLDMMIPYSSILPFYKTLRYSAFRQYLESRRTVWKHCGRVAGFYKQGGKLTELMVRNAGQLVPQDQPSASLALITAFIRNIPLYEDTCRLVPPPL